ncbi:MAG: hypothetical protein U0414_33720 [Polyangiaceae bacterium]
MICSRCKQDFDQRAMQLSPQGDWLCSACGSTVMFEVAKGGASATYARGMIVIGLAISGAGVYFAIRTTGRYGFLSTGAYAGFGAVVVLGLIIAGVGLLMGLRKKA